MKYLGFIFLASLITFSLAGTAAPVPTELNQMVGILAVGQKGSCSAVRLSANWLLTAAHCIVLDGNAENFQVLAPRLDDVVVNQYCKAIRSIPFPGWDMENNPIPDIALVELESNCPLPLNQSNFELPNAGLMIGSGTKVHEMGAYGSRILGDLKVVVETPEEVWSDRRVTPKQRQDPFWKNIFLKTDLTSLLLMKSGKKHRNIGGDSGGAIYMKSSKGSYILVGIITGGLSPSGIEKNIVADYGTSLFSPRALNFIHQYIRQ